METKIKNDEAILDQHITTDQETEYVDVEVTYEVKENIGAKEKIVF